MSEMPTNSDFKLVETYLKQTLKSRWLMPAVPPKEAITRVCHLFDATRNANPHMPVSLLILRILEFSSQTGFDRVFSEITHLYVRVLQRKYHWIPNWHGFFRNSVFFLEKRLGKLEKKISGCDEAYGEELLRALEELQSEDAAIAAVYAQCGLHFSD